MKIDTDGDIGVSVSATEYDGALTGDAVSRSIDYE